jgi:beta-lactamase class A
MNEPSLHERIGEISRKRDLTGVSVAVHDYRDGRSFGLDEDRWFHAASVIKVAVLLGVFKSIDAGLFRLDDPVHVRNRFRSVADGSIYRVERDRDGDVECHRRVGRTMHIAELARGMIVRSSNLATNLLVDLLGLELIQKTLSAAGIQGVRMVRGVEDNAAFERGLNNELTASGACQLFRVIHERHFLKPESHERMRDILLAQEFNAMIPAKLPLDFKIAHKTGEISTHSHDAGVVYPPERDSYVLAILTRSESNADQRSRAVAEISAEIFTHLSE